LVSPITFIVEKNEHPGKNAFTVH